MSLPEGNINKPMLPLRMPYWRWWTKNVCNVAACGRNTSKLACPTWDDVPIVDAIVHEHDLRHGSWRQKDAFSQTLSMVRVWHWVGYRGSWSTSSRSTIHVIQGLLIFNWFFKPRSEIIERIVQGSWNTVKYRQWRLRLKKRFGWNRHFLAAVLLAKSSR